MIALMNSFFLQVRVVASAVPRTVRNRSVDCHRVRCSGVMVVGYRGNTRHVGMVTIIVEAMACWNLFAVVRSHNMLVVMMVVIMFAVVVVVLRQAEVLMMGFLLGVGRQLQGSWVIRQVLRVRLAVRLYHKVVARRRVNALAVVHFACFALVNWQSVPDFLLDLIHHGFRSVSSIVRV